MPIPILWGLLALGVLAVSCSREEEVSPRPSDSPDAGPEPCRGEAHSLVFGREKAVFCLEESVKDGVFQPSSESLHLRYGGADTSYQNIGEWKRIREKLCFPEMSGLSLPLWVKSREQLFPSSERWSLEAEKLFSNAIDFSRERALDLNEVGRLASHIRPSQGYLELSPKEKAYAFMVAALLLSLRGDFSPSFYQAHRDFLKTVLQKIEEGRLRLHDLSHDGQKGDLFNRALYSLPDNTLLISEVFLDLTLTKDRSTLVHELFHFFQDSEKRQVSLVEGEVQAYLTEAEYALDEKKLLQEGVGEDLERFIVTEISGPKSDAHHPGPAALRAVFYGAHGDKKASEKWLEKCRDDAEMTKTMGGFFEILKGPLGPGKPGSVTSRFMRENASRLQEAGAEKIWEKEIADLKQAKKREMEHLKSLLTNSKAENEVLLRQYFRVLRASLDLVLMERLRIMRSDAHDETGSPAIGKDSSQENYLVNAAREIAQLRVNRRLSMPMDGVE